MIAHSQLAPLPVNVPFNVVSKTIGSGAYAWYTPASSSCFLTRLTVYSIKKAVQPAAPGRVFAVKFINKDYAKRHGAKDKQLDMEVTLHRHIGQHDNVIQFLKNGDDDQWRWIAMELAEGGDLFDKIESDVGVGEDVAHFYFTQLISAVEYMHCKGVAHRDLKPENILLSADGNLKIADFGLAALFRHRGEVKLATTRCGSPPYTAPEVLASAGPNMGKVEIRYKPDLVDIWSCGIILFVLLVGNTPWDEPLDSSEEFHDYLQTEGIPADELWHNLPQKAVPLLKSILNVKAEKRISIRDIGNHPWTRRRNQYMAEDGGVENRVGLATEMFESMKIDFSQDLASTQTSQKSGNRMDLDNRPAAYESTSNVATPTQEIQFDWERPSQAFRSLPQASIDERLSEEPSFSQFSATPQVPLTKTQIARRFRDILPAESLTRFYATCDMPRIGQMLVNALQGEGFWDPHRMAVSQGQMNQNAMKIRGNDKRKCPLSGEVEVNALPGSNGDVLAITFSRERGDPVEWRRLFKRVVLLCKGVVLRPDDHLEMLSQT